MHTTQDRITSDGRLITSPGNRSNAESAQRPFEADAPGRKRAPGVPMTAPATEPLTNAQVAELVDFVTGCKRMLVLTGAGCSTESNIPDYRGPKGAYSTGFQPMTHQQVRWCYSSSRECNAAYFHGWDIHTASKTRC